MAPAAADSAEAIAAESNGYSGRSGWFASVVEADVGRCCAAAWVEVAVSNSARYDGAAGGVDASLSCVVCEHAVVERQILGVDRDGGGRGGGGGDAAGHQGAGRAVLHSLRLYAGGIAGSAHLSGVW